MRHDAIRTVKGPKKPRKRSKNCPSGDLRREVDAVALSLFLEKGYENTTMRTISDKTGFGAGSLYNAFDGKEDILSDIILKGYDVVLSEADSFLKDFSQDCLVSLSFPLCVEMYMASTNEKYAELLNVAHQTWSIYDAMVDKIADWLCVLDCVNTLTKEELKDKMMICSAIAGRYIFQYCSEGSQDFAEGVRVCVPAICSLFKISADGIDITVQKVISLFDGGIPLTLFDSTQYTD